MDDRELLELAPEASGKCPRCHENIGSCVCYPTEDGPTDAEVTKKEQP